MITARAFATRHYAVFGLARTGLSVVAALRAAGATVTVWDDDAKKRAAIEDIQQDPSVAAAGYDCFCEIPQLQGTEEGEPLWACQNDTSRAPTLPNGDTVNGYCYIDQTSSPPIGNPELVSSCSAAEKRTIRFVGKGNPVEDATLFITCGVTEDETTAACDNTAH